MEFKCGSCKMMDFFLGGGEGGEEGGKKQEIPRSYDYLEIIF